MDEMLPQNMKEVDPLSHTHPERDNCNLGRGHVRVVHRNAQRFVAMRQREECRMKGIQKLDRAAAHPEAESVLDLPSETDKGMSAAEAMLYQGLNCLALRVWNILISGKTRDLL